MIHSAKRHSALHNKNNYHLLKIKQPFPTIAKAPLDIIKKNNLLNELNKNNELSFDLVLKRSTRTGYEFFEIGRLSELNEIWLDYQVNTLVLPMVSQKMKDIIENHLTGKEFMDWVSCKIHGNNEIRTYYIPRFNKELDVLDKERTMFCHRSNEVIVPQYDNEKAKKYSIFTFPTPYYCGNMVPNLYINDALKESMIKANLSGIKLD